MGDRVNLWVVANEIVWVHGALAPSITAQKAEALFATGKHSDAVAMRLLADACQTLLTELPVTTRTAS